MVSLQDVFAVHFDAYAQARRLHEREWQAASSILQCYTPAGGGHHDVCERGHVSAEVLHACRHRSCPRCAERARSAWADAELKRLLPCPHFHAVFTLPHELLALWAHNRQAMITLLMHSVRASVLEMLADPRHLGARPGLLLSLHTWGRNLSQHPHVHALVSAGGVRPDGRWVAAHAGFLAPVKPLRRLFAGKLLAGLLDLMRQDALRYPTQAPRAHWRGVIAKLYRKHWNLQINAAYDSGRSVTLYLARYAKGGPLPKDRELRLHDGSVSFEYTDHRDGRRKRQRLQAGEFIARILWHAPPKGVHVTRHAGLYATAAKAQHAQARLALAVAQTHIDAHRAPSSPITLPAVQVTAPPPRRCPSCGAPVQRRVFPRQTSVHQISLQLAAPADRTLPRSVPPGPTHRSNGQPTAGPARRRALSSTSRGQPLAAA